MRVNVKQISVVMSNEPGSVLRMARVLSARKIDMRALTVAESSTFSTVRLIVDNVLWASSVLKEAGFTVSLNDVTAIEVPDVPGGLTKVLEVLDTEGINIEYMYEIQGRKIPMSLGGGGMSLLVFRLNDNDKAVGAFIDEGIRVLGQGELSAV